MGIFSNLFAKSKVTNKAAQKMNKLNTTNPINKAVLADNTENPFKNFIFSIQNFFRTSRVVDAYQNVNNKKIDKLLTKGKSFYKSVKFPENNNFSLLHQAVSDRNLEIIDLILSKKYAAENDVINDVDNDLGLPPIHLACLYNYPEVLEILLKRASTSVNVLSATDDLSVLHVCANAGSLTSLVYLHENFYSKKKENEEEKLLTSADANGSKSALESDRSKKTIENNQMKHKFISRFNSSNMINSINKNLHEKEEEEKNECLLDVFNSEKWTPLHYACFNNKLDVTNYLIENGCDLLVQNNQKLSPLALAVLGDNFDLFYALYNFHFKNPLKEISSDKEFEIEVSEQAKLIHIAAISKKGTRCLDYLLADPNNVNMICSKELNATPLHFACMKSNLKAVKSLLRYNANVNVPDYLGNTPLFYATENGNLDILKALHEYGADGIRKNNNGVNCYQIAMNQDNRDVRLFYLSQNQYRFLSEKDKIF